MCDTQSKQKQNSKPGLGLVVTIVSDHSMYGKNPTPDTPRMVVIRDPRGKDQSDGIQNVLRYADCTPFPDLMRRMDINPYGADRAEIRHLTHDQAVEIAAWFEKMGDRIFTKPYLADLTERVHAALANPGSIPIDELAALVQESYSFLDKQIGGLMLAFFAEGAGLDPLGMIFDDTIIPPLREEKFFFNKFLDEYAKDLPKKKPFPYANDLDSYGAAIDRFGSGAYREVLPKKPPLDPIGYGNNKIPPKLLKDQPDMVIICAICPSHDTCQKLAV